MGAGNYVVNEVVTQSAIEDLESFVDTHPRVTGYGNQVIFTGDCSNVINSFEATGTIETGESQTCNVINQYFLLVFPEPTTASLTVNKEIYGCNNIETDPITGKVTMDCRLLLNNDPDWIQCDEITPSGRSICDALPENIFDIRVLDDENNQITEPFPGSPTGTTIENLEPGTYTVEEIKDPTNNINQLGANPDLARVCINDFGFTDGGELINLNEDIDYTICFEYED